MARPFQNPYEPVNSPGSDSPLSPYPRGGTPISFKTNVNRSKTKRWVEAKKISYDGNDWGDDDFDEYDEEEPPPPVPQPQSLNQSTGDLPSAASRNVPRPWLSSMDRSRSMDMVATLGTGSAGDSRSRSVDRNAPEQDQTLPMRPADIYQRLRGEQTAGPGHARGLSRSTTEPISMAVPAGKEAIGDRTPTERAQPESQSVTLRARDDVPVIGLPDVKRLSGFDVGLTTAPDTSAQNDQLPEPQQQEHQLHHEPSIGFRSVVHQAFDVPETPTTTIDSIARSDSNSTSLISPIIPQRGSTEKTPTIEEEPESTSPPRNFIPGHRRDLSIPSPNNSPLRRPIIMNNDTIAPETLAEMSSDSPVDLSQGHSTLPYQQPSVPATTTAAEDRPAPLKIGSMSAGPGENPIPVIVPSLSTENSPQDTDNDRLRKEIIRSLSRENTPSEGHEEQSGSRPQTSRQDSLIPSEYERYWNEAGGASPQDEFKPVLGHDHTQNASQDLYSGSPLQESPASNAAPQRDTTPKLKRRFSWESASSEEQPTQEQPTQEQPAPTATVQSPSVVQSPPVGPIPGQFPTFDESSTQPDLVTLPPRAEPQEEEAAERGSGPEKPKLTIIPPSATDSSSIISDRHLPEVVNAQIVGDAYSPAVAEQRTPAPAPTQSPSIESSLLGFREIMEMKTSDERVQAFNKTRDQFVTIDTGLNNWLRVTIHAHPEYTDVVQRSLKPSTDELKLPVSRNKFPKLSSLGNLVSSHQDGSSSGTGHVRRPSAPLGSMMNKQHVEQRGKEFLHTAGVFGGKAGEAAKGLFAKGRSKFKGGGGSDKGFESSRGYRRKFSFSELAIDLAEDTDKRRTVHFGSLPLMNGARAPQVNRFSLDIKRKQVPTVSACRPVEDVVADTGYHTDPEPSTDNRYRSGLSQQQILEKEVVAALRFSDDGSRSGHTLSYRGTAEDPAELEAPNGLELNAPSNSALGMGRIDQSGHGASSAHVLAVQHCRDCPPRKPLLKKEGKEESPPMSPIQVAINDAPLLIPEYKSDQRSISSKILSWTEQASHYSVEEDRLDPESDLEEQQISAQPQPPACEEPPAECNTTLTTPSVGKRYYSSAMETNKIPKIKDFQHAHSGGKDVNHHRRGSSVQIQLQPAPSISSLGTLDADRDPQQRSLGQILGQANSSRVSFLSDGGEGQRQSLGGIARSEHQTRIRDRPKSPWPGDEAEHASRRLSGVFRPLLSGSSKPRGPDAPVTTDHARSSSNPSAQPASKQAPAKKVLSTMDKLKVVSNKIRRPSMGSESLDKPHKTALDKLSGFFSRSNARGVHDNPKQKATDSPPPPAQTHRQIHSMERLNPTSSQHTSASHLPSSPELDRPRSNIENHTVHGQRPPPEGYFGPESFSRLRDTEESDVSLTQQVTVGDVNGTGNHRIPSPIEIRHRPSRRGSEQNGRPSPQSPPYRPPKSTSPRLPHHQLHQQSPRTASPQLTSAHRASPVPSTPQSPPSRGRSEDRSYAEDLHLRSRSPKAFAPCPEERHIPSADFTDPAYSLGTFRQNPRTSRIGDQERPWKLTIPGEDTADTDDALSWRQQTTKGVLQCGGQLPTYEEDSREHQPQQQQQVQNHPDEKPPLATAPRPSAPPHSQSTGNIHPTRGEGRTINLDAPVELPVQADDDSSEEITMSSTAYPGQEWRPIGFSGWD